MSAHTTTVSSKGQVVIPRAIRADANLQPGQTLEARLVDGEIRLRPVASVAALADVAGCLARPGRQRLSDDDTRRAIAQRVAGRHAPKP